MKYIVLIAFAIFGSGIYMILLDRNIHVVAGSSVYENGYINADSVVGTNAGREMEIKSSEAPSPAAGMTNRGPATAELASTTEELLASLNHKDADRIAWFSTTFGDYLQFTSSAQLEWMARNGYPMPEDIINSASLSNQELEERARNGDAKAAAFLIERVLRQNSSQFTSVLSADDRLVLMRMRDALRNSSSPFSGYAESVAAEALGNPSAAVAGLISSAMLGDARAAETAHRTAVELGVSEDAIAVGLAVAMHAQSVRDNNGKLQHATNPIPSE